MKQATIITISGVFNHMERELQLHHVRQKRAYLDKWNLKLSDIKRGRTRTALENSL